MTTSTNTPPRVIQFERCYNFRDIGGYAGRDGRRVRWRQVFRSMTPEYMSQADVAKARALGINLVVDLRGGRYTSGPLAEAPARRVHVSSRRSWRWAPGEAQAFREWPPEVAMPVVAEKLGRSLTKAVVAIADAEGPALFHCRLGKDRSGIVGALLLKLVGVSDDDVIADYLLSGDVLSQAQPLLNSNSNNPLQGDARVVREPASRPGIEAVLKYVEAEGGAYAFLRKRGAPKYKLDALIERLLEPSA